MVLGRGFTFLLKVCYRGADYLRGLWFFFIINFLGGNCSGIPRVGTGVVLKYPPHPGISIGRCCSIGPFCVFDAPPGCSLIIGDNVKLTAGVFISAIQKVSIGDDCLIAEWTSIRDSQHKYKRGDLIRRQGLEMGEVVLESDVWLGRASAVFMGSVLQRGCVVGAHGLVKEQVLDADAVYAGAPVRKIGDRKD